MSTYARSLSRLPGDLPQLFGLYINYGCITPYLSF
nr:MAG TPA: hypothetical protein [Herelleviridae sp.]